MKTFLFFLLSLFVISCSTTKESTKSTDDSPSYDSYSKTASLSTLSKSLIDEIKKEKKYLQKNQKYTPSQKLVDEFKLFKISNIYFVRAILKINEEIDPSVLEAVGVKVETKAGKTWTIQIPVDMLEDLANYSGVDYIQIDE